jgi:hypothetical protein
MATLFVDKIDPQSGTSLEIGSSGDTLDLSNPSTVTLNSVMKNTPAFFAKLNGDQFPSNQTATTLSASGENFDVGGCYNNTGSTVTLNGISVPAYSFAPNVAGKYYISAKVNVNATGSDNVSRAYVALYKNTDAIGIGDFNSSNQADIMTRSVDLIVELNGTSDYVTAKGYGTISSGTLRFKGDTTEARTYFQGYKLIE